MVIIDNVNKKNWFTRQILKVFIMFYCDNIQCELQDKY